MSRYATLPDGARDIRHLKLRVKSLEARLANLGGQPAGTPPATVYDANVIYNGGMESGTTGWEILYFTGAAGTISLEQLNPLDGLFSTQVNEAAASFSRVFWLPAESTSSIVVGADVFATTPGDVWLLSCLIQPTVDVPDATLAASTGVAAADVYGLGGSTTWLTAASGPISANTPTTLSGTVTVPAGRNFIGLHVAANPSATVAAAWSWDLDVVSMQRQL